MNPIEQVRVTDETCLQFLQKFANYELRFAETSVKIFADRIKSNRVLAALPKSSISLEGVIAIAESMNIHNSYIDNFIKRYYDKCRTIGFGLEKDGNNINHRIYIEAVPTDIARIRTQGFGTELQTIEGVKWNVSDPLRTQTSKYYLQFKSDEDTRIKTVKKAGLSFFPSMVSVSNTSGNINGPTPPSMFLSVDSGFNKRIAFYISTGNMMTKDNVTEDVYSFTSVDLKKELEIYDNDNLAVVAGGLEANNEQFLTLYFRYVPTSDT
jgi:hypothetical protein